MADGTQTSNDDLTIRAAAYLNAEEIEPGKWVWKRFDGWICGGKETMQHAAFGNHPFAPKPKLLPCGCNVLEACEAHREWRESRVAIRMDA